MELKLEKFVRDHKRSIAERGSGGYSGKPGPQTGKKPTDVQARNLAHGRQIMMQNKALKNG